MAVTIKRSLYQCSEAKVRGDRIYCAKDHPIGGKGNITIPLNRLTRGDPLELTVCQRCPHYRRMGPPIPPEGRGWV